MRYAHIAGPFHETARIASFCNLIICIATLELSVLDEELQGKSIIKLDISCFNNTSTMHGFVLLAVVLLVQNCTSSWKYKILWTNLY
jgi:hypothetical protein